MLQAAEIKLAEQRLSMLELAKALGNVSAPCKQRGMSRTQFYEYKRQYLWSHQQTSWVLTTRLVLSPAGKDGYQNP